jgi:hypothetical protein
MVITLEDESGRVADIVTVLLRRKAEHFDL